MQCSTVDKEFSLWLRVVLYNIAWVCLCVSMCVGVCAYVRMYMCACFPPPLPQPSRPSHCSPVGPASSAAGCGCARRIWWHASLCGCWPAGGRAPGSAHSQLWRARADLRCSSSGGSPLPRAQPPTTAASAHHACLGRWGGRIRR